MTDVVQRHESPTLDKAAEFMKSVEITVNSVQEELVLLQKQTESASSRVLVLSEQLNTVQKMLLEAQTTIHNFEEEKRSGVAKYLRLREENAALRDQLYALGQKPTTDADC